MKLPTAAKRVSLWLCCLPSDRVLRDLPHAHETVNATHLIDPVLEEAFEWRERRERGVVWSPELSRDGTNCTRFTLVTDVRSEC